MASLKAVVRKKMTNGMYTVFIRIIQNRQISYIKTPWYVNSKGLSRDKKDIIDSFVVVQATNLIEKYYNQLNVVDASGWTAKEVMEFLVEGNSDKSFSDYTRNHIEKMINEGRERTSRNYKWALLNMEKYACTNNIMFSRLTSSFINNWIESLAWTAECKEKYPVCLREVYKAAIKEFNDPERGIVVLRNPWTNVIIPKCDVPQKRAIPADMLRKFFQYIPTETRYSHPLCEFGQDFALISFCLCGVNAVDIYYAEKGQYSDGIFHYERRKTKKARADNGYFEVKVPELLKPTFEKYLCKDMKSPWLFNFHNRMTTEDSFSANVNIGIRQVWEKISPNFKASYYAFRHSWATIAQNNCGASLNEVDFALNHSTNKMARIYVKIDFSPAWALNEKVIDFVFFSDKQSTIVEKEKSTFEKLSKYNNIHAEAYIMGKLVSKLEDTGFTNVDQVMDELTAKCSHMLGSKTRIQYKITNVDKQMTQMYQRLV